MNNSEKLIKEGKKVFINTYSQIPLVIEKGNGVYVEDKEENKYLDFVSGIAVNCLGYNNKNFINNITEQLNKIAHCSNLYWNEPAIEAAKLLVKNSGLDKVFFCNSGAESVEAALKLSRNYQRKFVDTEHFEVISMEKSFHGRTFGAVTVTGQTKYQKNIDPLLPGIKYAKFNDFDSVCDKVTNNTCAIILEPVQGEGGIWPADKEFLEKVRKLCDEKNIVLIFDEVQCGMGRLGTLFAYQHFGVKPDIVCLAKGLGGGLPIGAIISNQEVSEGFEPGDHASTFGGNLISTTAAKTVLLELTQKDIIGNVKKQGEYLKAKLIELKKQFNCIEDVRGIGLMQGIQLTFPVKTVIENCLQQGLMLIGAGNNVIRLVPPLIIKEDSIDKAIEIIKVALMEVDK